MLCNPNRERVWEDVKESSTAVQLVVLHSVGIHQVFRSMSTVHAHMHKFSKVEDDREGGHFRARKGGCQYALTER